MAVVTGGDILEISYNNPDVGAGFLFPVSGEDATYDLGGFINEDDAKTDGAQRLIVAKTNKPWSFQVVVANDMATSQELEACKALQRSLQDTIFSFSHVNGTVYKGKGVIVGALELSGMKSSFTLKVMGGGQLSQ